MARLEKLPVYDLYYSNQKRSDLAGIFTYGLILRTFVPDSKFALSPTVVDVLWQVENSTSQAAQLLRTDPDRFIDGGGSAILALIGKKENFSWPFHGPQIRISSMKIDMVYGCGQSSPSFSHGHHGSNCTRTFVDQLEKCWYKWV